MMKRRTLFPLWLATVGMVACDPSSGSKSASSDGDGGDGEITTEDPGDTDTGDEAEGLGAALELIDDSAVHLSELAAEAVAVSPAWIRDDLTLAFLRLDEDVANELAATLLDVDEPWLIDEVAFSIAHTSPSTMPTSPVPIVLP